MANFGTKILGLAGPALVFAGMAFGQATCNTAPTSNTIIIRAEGTTELVAPLTFTCTAPAGSTAGTAAIQIFMSPALPVTSKALNTSSPPATEAIAVVSGSATQYNGTVSGSNLNFSGVALPALAAGGTFTVTISNVRVNATSLPLGSGVPPAVTETVFISGSAGSINPGTPGAATVAFGQNGLGGSSLRTGFTSNGNFPNGTTVNNTLNPFVICNAYSPSLDAVNLTTSGNSAGRSLAFVVRVNEANATAFKNAAGEASQVVTTLASNAVVSGTRFSVNFANVPANVTLYVPNGLLTSGNSSAATAQYTNAAAGSAFAGVSGATANAITSGTGLTAANGLVAVTTTAGAGSATFEIVTSDPNNVDQFNIPVFVVTTANTVVGSTTPITASVNFAPIGGGVIPSFSVGSSTTTLTDVSFNTCSTSLLFPFVTNLLGFDTGIAIANTSTDPFAKGATPQSGTCKLYFYGGGAPSPANIETPNVPTGTVYPLILSGVAAGFQGYIIAQCGFQYAHGFAFITDGVGANGGLSQGYLAGVIPDTNQKTRGADPLSSALAGTGETLGN